MWLENHYKIIEYNLKTCLQKNIYLFIGTYISGKRNYKSRKKKIITMQYLLDQNESILYNIKDYKLKIAPINNLK